MTANLIDGKAIAAEVRHNIKKKVDARRQNGLRFPGLAVVTDVRR
jgi:methylenetetrahydrofolate dehydrogenase (NADP+)/methenyltetrahydrofolate cyclohydrolase